MPAAWVSLDPGDNEPSRFWTYCTSALEQIYPGAGEAALPMLRANPPTPPAVVLPVLINALAGMTQNSVLVLDDYHVITSPEVHEGVSYLLERGPERLHLVLTTRADPPLSLARLRVRGQLAELRTADLRFAPAEAAAFFAEAPGLPFSSG